MATQGYARPPFSPTRFPAGITNANVGDILANLATVDPTKLQIFWEDFIAAPAALGVTTGVAGAGGLATAATTVAVDTPTACFVLDPTKRFFFAARLSLATVADAITVGFADSLAAPDDGVVVNIDNNALTVSNLIGGSAVETDTYTATTANTVMYQVGFEYDPRKGVTVYLDGSVVARINPAALTTENLVAGVYPDGATATLDYIFAAVER